ncbi:MAG: phosphotransferase [Alphaproteobacteria bacterium]|nr:phosphotransferase [Alphaproteobacteria bacterium]
MTNPREYFSAHVQERDFFIASSGGNVHTLISVGEDWSSRRYFRVTLHSGKTAILMETLPDHLGGGGAGHRLADFIRLAEVLRSAGLNAPDILSADPAQGYALIEDMGNVTFREAMTHPHHTKTAYQLAVDVLIHLRSLSTSSLNLPDYFSSHIHTARRRVVEWYMPLARARVNEPGLSNSFLTVMDYIQNSLPPCPTGFVHGDFHPGNLMWRDQAHGLARAGILDFQGAMTGPMAYDVANLLWDAQGDIPADIRHDMLTAYLRDMRPEEQDVLKAWIALIAVQFHSRVIGQVIKLSVRADKTKMMAHLPRLQAYLRSELKQDMFAPLRIWFDDHGITFNEDINVNQPERLIAPDAL